MAFDYDSNGTPVGGFDYDENGNPVSVNKPAERTFGGTVKDVGISALKSAISVPEAAVGLADIPTGGMVGNLVESAGVRFKEAKRILDEELSQAQQAANKRVEQADGFFPTIGALFANPSVIGHGAIESLGSMGAGGVIGRGVVGIAPKVSPWIAAAIGEGSVTAGSMAESTRQTTGDLTAAQAGMSVAAGVGTGALGAIGGRLAKRLGVDDVDTMLVKGIAANSSEEAAVETVKKGIARRILEGGLSEGVFEELPQSAQEQVWQNAALGKPLMEGVDKAAAQGMLVGAAMGGGGNLLGSLAPTVADIDKAPTLPDAIAAAEAALAAPIDTLSPAIDAFKGEWAADAARVPADSAIPMIGMSVDVTAPQDIALPTDGTPAGQAIVTPDKPAGPALIALAEQLAVMGPEAQTAALMRLDSDMRQRVVQTMRALDPAVPSGIITPTADMPPGQGEAARILNEQTVAASSVQPVGDATVTNVPALTQRAAQELVRVSPGTEMRPHREVAGRFEVVPAAAADTAGPARGVFSTQPVPVTQQMLSEQETPTTIAPAVPAARPVVPPVTLTAEQTAANQAAADAERSSQPRKSVFRNSQLRSETGPDIKGERVTRNMRKVLAMMGRITGTKVVFEYAPEDSDGAVPNRSENTVHINTAAQINPMQVMGHEVTHVLRDRHAKAWMSVRDALVATMPDKRKALDAFAADYWGGNEKNLAKLAAARDMSDWSAALTPEQKTRFGTSENSIEAFLLDEMVSDLGGQHWSSEAFWTDVFAKIEKQEGAKAKGIIERLVISIKETLGKFLEIVRAQKQGDYGTVSAEQLEKTRDAISSAYAEFIRAERRVEPDGGPHDTHHRISTSDTHSRTQVGDGEPSVAPATVPAVTAATDDGDDLAAARARELASLSPARAKRDQRLFFEVAPNPNDKAATAAWNAKTDAEKQAASTDTVERIIPGLLKDIGVTGEVVTQLGGWKQYTNPSFALVVSKGDPQLAARAIGYVLDQEAVYALGLKPFTGAEKTGIIHFNIGRKDAHNIYKQVRDLARGIITGHSTVGSEMLIGLPMADMKRLESAVDAIARKADIAVNFDTGYGSIIKEYGYGIQQGVQNSRQQHPTARDVDKWRTEARGIFGQRSDGGSSNVVGGRVAEATSRGVSAVGIHYSQSERSSLSSAAYGTGLKGAEIERIAQSDDPRIKQRIYFYVNAGRSVRPELGVGAHAHRAQLTGLYDQEADPKDLTVGRNASAFESAVLDAGYDGYISHTRGIAVLLGQRNVPVTYVGLNNNPDVPLADRDQPSQYRTQLARIEANKSIPSGQMRGEDWKRLIPALMKGIDVSHLDDTQMYYKSQLVQRPETARMSEARSPSWYFSPLARAADTASMKTAPAAGWKDWLKSLPAKGVKPDEIKWSGITEWLDAQGDASVTKQQVQAYLSEFGIRIETILRGERNPVRPETVSQNEPDEDNPIDPDVTFGNWETDDPDMYSLQERANERFEEAVDELVEDRWRDINDDLQRENNAQIEAMLPDLRADVRRAMGDMFPVEDDLVEQVARNYAAARVAGDTWQEYGEEEEQAVDSAFAVLSGDMDALETEARRRVRAEIDDDNLLDELYRQEERWYWEDSESPASRTVTVEVDGDEYEFNHSMSYGEHYVSYNGREVTLPRNNYRTDDADIQSAVLEYLRDDIGVSFAGTAGDDSYRPTKWESFATDNRRAVSGSYREIELTLPPGTVGQPKTYTSTEYNYYDREGTLIGSTMSEDVAKKHASYKKVEQHVETERAATEDFYYTTHFPDANIVGHARFDEHIDDDGKRVMVLQEVQGDWGQQRREGLASQERAEQIQQEIDEKSEEQIRAIVALKQALPEAEDGWKSSDWQQVDALGARALSNDAPSDALVAADKLSVLHASLRELRREYNNLSSKTPPPAPFIEKTTQWAALVMKRMISHAIDYKFDKVVWTSGAQQVERWRNGLRQQVDQIAWEKTTDGIHIVASQNGRVRTDTKVAENALSDAIGKQMAKQIIADPNQSGEITGNDITISDTGMAGFYDRMLPNITNDVLKKLDKTVQVKDITVHETDEYDVANTPNGWVVLQNGRDIPKYYEFESEAIAAKEKREAAQAAEYITTQQGFEITDAMRASAANGIPLMSERRASSEGRAAAARKEWYRSQLSEAVGGLPAKIKTGKEAAVWLQANAGKLQVKKDELQWSGVLDWLQAQGVVTGEQIQDWLANNGVRVKDVMLGEESDEYRRLDAELQEAESEIDRLRKAALDDGVLPQNRGDIPAVAELAAKNNPAAETRLLQLGVPKEKLSAVIAYGKALNRKNELFEQRKAAMGERVKFNRDDLNLPGGKPGTYRELLLTLPDNSKQQTYEEWKAGGMRGEWSTKGVSSDRPLFRSGHYQQPNILAHVRFDERTDADGKRVLFVQEVQSDWGQKGRKDGFADPESPVYAVFAKAGAFLRSFERKTEAESYAESVSGVMREEKRQPGDDSRPPAAPFVTETKSWVALALKRMIAHAVDNGFDRVAFTTGEQQAERYDLSKQISSIRYNKIGGEYGIVAIGKSESRSSGIVMEETVPESRLEEIVGKDIAKKIIAGEGTPGKTELNNGDVIDTKSFSGLDLKVGGEGMKGFYDRIVPQVARQLGATMREVNLPNPYRPSSSGMTMAEADANLKKAVAEWKPTQPQPGFDITDKMREQVRIGMPLFSERRASPTLDQWLGDSKVRTVMYHGTARDISTFRPQQADAIFLTDDPEFAANFADLSHSWMVNNYWTWMSPEQIQEARRDAMRMLLKDALPGSSLYNREERLLNQKQADGQYMRRAVEQFMPSESNIMPLYVRAENPFDFRNPEHVAAIEREIGPSWNGQENINGKVSDVAQHIGDLERGDWNAIESKPVQDYIRANHDSFYVRERGVTNLAVFSPNQVKSASGNDGSYSREDNDIRRSEMRPVDTSSPEFRKWFDGGAVSDSDGTPVLLYHGTATSSLTEFAGHRGVAGHFAFEPEFANGWAEARHIEEQDRLADGVDDLGDGGVVYPVYLNVRNIFDLRNKEHLQKAGLDKKRVLDYEDLEAHLKEIENAGFDSYLDFENSDEPTGIAVFKQSNIKSAISNTGEFSRINPDIRYSHRRATWTTERIDRLMRKYAYTMDDNKTKAFAAWIDPEDFLRMTSAQDDLARIEREAGELDEAALRENDQELFLEVSDITASMVRVEGHEGRHRTTALIKAGVRKMPVVLWLRSGAMRNAESAKSLYLAPQKFGSEANQRAIGGGFVTDLTPISYAYEQQLRDTFGGDGDVAFSTPRSRITGQPINKTWNEPDTSDWDDLVRKLQDSQIDTKRIVRAIRDAGVAVAERFNPYLMETNYHGRAASRVKSFADNDVRKLLEDMQMRGIDMQMLDDYLWARHAPERNAQNAKTNPAITDGSGMSDADAAAILAGRAVTLNGRTIQIDPRRMAGLSAVAARVDSITKGTLDLLVQYGLETQQTVDTWKNTYGTYVPLKRDMESDANFSGAFGLGMGTGSGFDVRGAASRRALGSKREVTDILANVFMQRERAITRGEKNRVAQSVYGLALTAPNPDFWIPLNPTLNKGLSPTALQAVIAELVALGINPLDAQNIASEPVQRFIDPRTGLESQRINPQLRNRDDVLSTRINGEERYVMFSNKQRAQDMVRNLKNLDAADVSGFAQFVAPVTRWFSSVNTQYNPVFGITNGIRDFSSGMLNLSSTPLSADRAAVARNAFDALRGIYIDLRDHRAGKQPTSQWARLFEQFAADGGQTGYRDMFATSADRAEAIADELKAAGKGKQWVMGGERHSVIFGWLSDYNTSIENAMRLAAYKVALDKGMSRDAAASLAKNLTVNFNKKGLAATQTGALYAFFNAAVQGTARIGETMTTDGKLNSVGKKIIYGGITLGVMQAVMGALAGWDDDEPPQFSREKNFIIPVPGSDKYISVPMPLGFHVIPNFGRIVTEFVLSGGRDPGKRLSRIAGLLLDSFNPIGSGTLAQTLSPTVGDPIVALAENKDWTGKSIFKDDFNKMHPTPGWTRKKDTASPVSSWLAYGLNYITGGGKYEIGMASPTPDQIDYLVGQATGGVGRELLKTSQYVMAKATGEELPLYKTPLGVGRFVGETKGQSSETSKFYRNLERIGQHKSALAEMKEAGDGDAIREYLRANPEAKFVQTADKAQREIGYLRRQKREMIERGVSRERVKLMDEKITAMTARYNEVLSLR